MKNLSKKLREELGAQGKKFPTRSAVKSLPNGYELDQILVDIVKEFNGAVVFTRGAKIVINSKAYHLDIIYGLSSDDNDIYYKNEIYRDQIPNSSYTFGESPEGDQFCIDFKTNDIYYWKHDATDIEKNFVLLTSNLTNFIKNLVTDEETDLEAMAKSKKIVSIDLDF